MRYLVDVNCLIALSWPNHVHHSHTRNWFVRHEGLKWVTTPGVQSGFVRVSMNPRVTGTSVTFAEAVEVLRGLMAFGTHDVVESVPGLTTWPPWLSIRVQGYRQVTDASLLACALKNNLVVATLDAGMCDLTDNEHRDIVHLIFE